MKAKLILFNDAQDAEKPSEEITLYIEDMQQRSHANSYPIYVMGSMEPQYFGHGNRITTIELKGSIVSYRRLSAETQPAEMVLDDESCNARFDNIEFNS